MKFAITGAAGYVGGSVTEKLRILGYDVLALSRRPCKEPWLSFSLHEAPISLPWGEIDVLVHAAHDFSATTWQEMMEKNIKPSISLLNAARQAGVPHVIFISSLSAFEGCKSIYGKAKLMIENETTRRGVVALRPGLVWGSSSGGIMATFEKLVAKSPVVPFPVASSHFNQYLIHEEDLCNVIVSFSHSATSQSGAPHSVAHPLPIPLPVILRTIADRIGVTRIFLPVPWQFIMAGLCFLKTVGIQPPFRTDSLIGLVHGYPQPENPNPLSGISYRPFC